jgi:C-terminal processing protease CtpA/Prc
MYLTAQSLTPDGTVMEGYGVIPDITVPSDRAVLLKGMDTQIERAIVHLKSEID